MGRLLCWIGLHDLQKSEEVTGLYAWRTTRCARVGCPFLTKKGRVLP